MEKATDINLAVDMLSSASKKNCDTVILISADGDFTKAVEAIKDMGVNVEVACFTGHSSKYLNEKADKIHWLNGIDLTPCAYKK